MSLRVLIANRGEIACRAIATLHELQHHSIAVFTPPDSTCAHVSHAHESIAIDSYLSIPSIISAALSTRATHVYPGYGFLSEVADLARACVAAGLVFIGPTPEQLELFGDKLRARQLALDEGVPVVWGSSELSSMTATVAAVRQARDVGVQRVVLKAVLGGGGKGMRVLSASGTSEEIEAAYASCVAETRASFDHSRVFVEQFVAGCRHVEVQLVNDVVLGDRDCTCQRRHQKVVELAPSPFISPAMRQRLHELAARLARACGYQGAGTVEFLVDVAADKCYFMEMNPRIQVEHTITEVLCNCDIVEAQLRVALGLPLDLPKPLPAGAAFALQARITATRPGDTVQELHLPRSHGVRVDSHLFRGYTVPPEYDALLVKVICHAPTFERALRKLIRAVRDTRIDGVSTNIEQLLTILTHRDFAAGCFDTNWLDTLALDAPALEPPAPLPTATSVPTFAVPTPGRLGRILVKPGQDISPGAPLCTILAMKMETTVVFDSTRPAAVVRVLAREGEIVQAGTPLLTYRFLTDPAAPKPTTASPPRLPSTASAPALPIPPSSPWAPELEELARRRELAAQCGGEKRVARQHAAGKMTVRERISALFDQGSFQEVGSLAGSGKYTPDGLRLRKFLAANFVGGVGAIDSRPVACGGDDFTNRGGHADGGIFAKQVYIEKLARHLKIPMVRLLDGSSGGGSVASILKMNATYVPMLPGFEVEVPMLDEVPVVALLLGPVVGFAAARAMLSHFSVMVTDLAQLFVAGPPIVEWATHESLGKNELGGVAVHATNGSVDNVASSELDAFRQARTFLSFLPSNTSQSAPRVSPTDTATRRDPALVSVIPRARTQTYDVRGVIEMLLDTESFFEIGATWGRSIVTGLARLHGFTVAVITSDCRFVGGCLTADACRKVTRFLRLINAFRLPVVSLVDQPGFAVGLAAEQEATIRHGGEMLEALYRTDVPWFSVLMRRCFGVGGAAFADRGDPDLRVAWPSGDFGSLPLEGGLEAAYKRKLANSDDARAELEQLRTRFEVLRSPLRTAEKFFVEEVIDPRDTRPLLCRWIKVVHAASAL